MSAWTSFRASLTAAFAWAVPWGLIGGSLFLAFEILKAPRNVPLAVYLVDGTQIFLVGAAVAGVLGAIAGRNFASRLRAWARREPSAELATSRAVALGAASGAIAVAAPMLFWALSDGRPPILVVPFMLIAAAVGAGSAYAMVALARRASSLAPASHADQNAVPMELRAAHAEVEHLLGANRELSMLGTQSRRRESVGRVPPEEDGLV